jgi:hypothetical protein
VRKPRERIFARPWVKATRTAACLRANQSKGALPVELSEMTFDTRVRPGGKGAARFFLVSAAAALVATLLAACSSKSASPPAPKCVPSQCAMGNDCIDDGSGAGPSCHKTCSHPGGDCPSGWYCNDGQPKSWCVQNTTSYPAATGQWTACEPPKESNNPACDSADGFACYGISPTDANAFCTVFGCQADSDCPGGWWCATVNDAPNVTTVHSTFGSTRQVCMPREYCAPCQLDHDCTLMANGSPQHCVTDTQGNGYCTSRCGGSGDCRLDAQCVPHWKLCLPGNAAQTCSRDEDCPPSAQNVAQHCDFGPSGDAGPAAQGVCAPECGSDSDCDPSQAQHCQDSYATYCAPRAGVCDGDGSLCAPCRSDADCKGGGFCLDAPYSDERFCSQAAKATCPSGAALPGNACPAKTGSQASVACTTEGSDFAPTNQCIGLVTIGASTGQASQVPGCWTVSH